MHQPIIIAPAVTDTTEADKQREQVSAQIKSVRIDRKNWIVDFSVQGHKYSSRLVNNAQHGVAFNYKGDLHSVAMLEQSGVNALELMRAYHNR